MQRVCGSAECESSGQEGKNWCPSVRSNTPKRQPQQSLSTGGKKPWRTRHRRHDRQRSPTMVKGTQRRTPGKHTERKLQAKSRTQERHSKTRWRNKAAWDTYCHRQSHPTSNSPNPHPHLRTTILRRKLWIQTRAKRKTSHTQSEEICRRRLHPCRASRPQQILRHH